MKTLELTVTKGNKIISTLKKYYNGKWNNNTKTWTVEIKEKDEDVFFANFSEYITKEKTTKEEIKADRITTKKRRYVQANHTTPGHYVYETGNYGEDVLSGFYQEG